MYNMKNTDYVDFIVEQMQNGNVDRADILAIFGKKWHKSERTFDRYFKAAKELHQKWNEERNDIKNKKLLKKEKELIEMGLLTQNERFKIADDIAKGTERKIKVGAKEEILIPSAAEQLKALDYLAKVHGDYAAQKTELTGANGKDLIPDRPIIVVSTKHGDIK